MHKAGYEILEVAVESESLIREREKCLKIFRKEFLGNSSNAKNSFIMNEEVISFLNPKVGFEKDGFFEPEAILWYGYMAMARIADWLPYEYTPSNGSRQ